MSIDPTTLTNQAAIIEDIEKASTRMVCQAVLDFAPVAKQQFSLAKDLAGTVGEDVTRDAMESMGLSKVPTARLIGKIDYKRAVYYFDPNYWIRQALFVDSKAEKDAGTATIQISQTSLRVRLVQKGAAIDVPGQLDTVLTVGNELYLVTTVFVKYHYTVNVWTATTNCLPFSWFACPMECCKALIILTPSKQFGTSEDKHLPLAKNFALASAFKS